MAYLTSYFSYFFIFSTVWGLAQAPRGLAMRKAFAKGVANGHAKGYAKGVANGFANGTKRSGY